MNIPVKPVKLFAATKAIIRNKDRILILRQGAKYIDGAISNLARYDVPGGRVELGERFDQSLLREIKEETDLDVTVGKVFFVDEWRPVVRGEQWQIIGMYFICDAKSEDVRLSEDHDDFKWVLPEECAKYSLYPGVERVIQKYIEEQSL